MPIVLGYFPKRSFEEETTLTECRFKLFE